MVKNACGWLVGWLVGRSVVSGCKLRSVPISLDGARGFGWNKKMIGVQARIKDGTIVLIKKKKKKNRRRVDLPGIHVTSNETTSRVCFLRDSMHVDSSVAFQRGSRFEQ